MDGMHMSASRTTGSIVVSVNGDDVSLVEPATVAALVDVRKPRPPFAVEVNKQLVRFKEYEVTPLAAGDCVEIVTLVGGG